MSLTILVILYDSNRILSTLKYVSISEIFGIFYLAGKEVLYCVLLMRNQRDKCGVWAQVPFGLSIAGHPSYDFGTLRFLRSIFRIYGKIWNPDPENIPSFGNFNHAYRLYKWWRIVLIVPHLYCHNHMRHIVIIKLRRGKWWPSTTHMGHMIWPTHS